MNKARLEAFSDGVIAIIITIMVLELRPPHQASWESLKPLLPQFMSYILSFAIIGIYWGNHHHLVHTVTHVNSRMMWANLHLLFWLSLIPFATAWTGENNFERNTVVTYAAVLDLSGIAYYILLRIVENTQRYDPKLTTTLHKQVRKGILSVTFYTLAIIAAFIYPIISRVLIVLVAVLWWWPDRNIEQLSKAKES